MNWTDDQLQKGAEDILGLFDLTSLEVDRATQRWNKEVGYIPETFFDSSPPGFALNHVLAKLQQIATDVVRERSYKE